MRRFHWNVLNFNPEMPEISFSVESQEGGLELHQRAPVGRTGGDVSEELLEYVMGDLEKSALPVELAHHR